MLTSLAYIFLIGILVGSIFNKFRLPRLLGMILTGIIIGPYVFNILDGSILAISTDLRKLALIIILTRAGLALDFGDLKKVGRAAILMCFLPACFEILAMVMIAPKLLGISTLDAAIMGAVVAAVSPAVIVPRMLNLIEKKCGTDKSIPQLIMAGASVDDVFVIVLFTSFIGLAQGQKMSAMSFAQIPVSIIIGILAGIVLGGCLVLFFKRININDTMKVIILLSVSFLLVALEDKLKGIVPISGLIAIMSIGVALQKRDSKLAKSISIKFSELWIGAEVVLFVLVGATVDINYAISAGSAAVILIFIVLIFRMIGVYCCLIKSDLSIKERIFCMIAYTPKATVQAAIGAIPLSMGLPCGKIVLTVAVLSILVTAPLGAFFIDITYKKLLQ
ncbi:cation:proton antiporter [Asaccharospora irregularis]|uniref:NhaP-type Na+/H+ or K+/H+ antiporter n=1 Tax=Asaccharospora irregularis DSM 2635 TaxID=1121321 RepID=A0A1M5LLN9_9FIRM|nr:cation:proton antiporter [Asaccharospora irregularis]SHG66062.1 NhaP-type Na+/H+ or K+/H+ antiporter [Asaccharospora irregularis DSM 2635]